MAKSSENRSYPDWAWKHGSTTAVDGSRAYLPGKYSGMQQALQVSLRLTDLEEKIPGLCHGLSILYNSLYCLLPRRGPRPVFLTIYYFSPFRYMYSLSSTLEADFLTVLCPLL